MQTDEKTVTPIRRQVSWSPEVLLFQLYRKLLFEQPSLFTAWRAPAVTDSQLELFGLLIAFLNILLACFYGGFLGLRDVFVGPELVHVVAGRLESGFEAVVAGYSEVSFPCIPLFDSGAAVQARTVNYALHCIACIRLNSQSVETTHLE